jgi:hypothetical protein
MPKFEAIAELALSGHFNFSECLTVTSLGFVDDCLSSYCATVSFFEVAVDVPKPFRRDQC